jgi:hypothetical protein
LIDKARAAMAGTLGTYLFGQSPVDSSLLGVLQLGHTEFATIVKRSADDRAVLAALDARDRGCLERARAWSEKTLPQRFGTLLWFIDVDDGYRPNAWHTPIALVANIVSGTAKRLWPSRAAARAAAAGDEPAFE